MNDRRRSTPIADFERRLVPYYPIFVALGILCFVVNWTLTEGPARWIALVWVVAVPLWISRYRVYRRNR